MERHTARYASFDSTGTASGESTGPKRTELRSDTNQQATGHVRVCAPFTQRYRRGKDSPEGCYHDSFDFDTLHRVLLDPLGPNGDRRYQDAIYDRSTDTALSLPVTTAPADAVLLFDGVFLLRPELIDRWDLRIFVSATFEQALDRARIRDQALYGSTADVERRYRSRYIPSQHHYFATARPTDHADIIVHNDELQRPTWEVRPY